MISDILGAREPYFTQEIRRLEALTGHPKVDVRLISELVGTWQSVAREFGLDSRDTTAKELYFAMREKIFKENDELAQKLNINSGDSPHKVAELCAKYVESKVKSMSVWSLKNSVIKSQLKQNPPKRLLKILGLRSIDSALKREPVGQLVVLAEMVESKTWRDTFISQANKLKNSDFDRNQTQISVVSKNRVDKMRASGHALGHLVYRQEESASLIIVPPQKRFRGDVVFFVDSLIRENNEIRRHSSFVKYLSVRNDFAKWLESIRAKGLDHAAAQHFNFGWSPVHRLLLNKAKRNEEPLFEPHLDHDDVILTSYEIKPIWQCAYLLKSEDGVVVSCNISDVIINAANNASAEKASSFHGRRELYNELFSRYLDHSAALEDFIRRQP